MQLPGLGLVCLVIIGAGIGRKVPVPDGLLWCALGFAAAFVPHLEAARLDPDVSLFLLLPPLVYSSAVQLPWPEFRDNLRPISLLAIGLVLVTTVMVAAAAHSLASLSWPVAAALGALISPTDPVAASAVAKRVGLPYRLVVILEGEGLVNDAVALTVLRISIAAAVTGHFSIAGGIGRFVAILIAEPIYGVLVGAAILFVRVHIEDPRLEIAISLLTPFAAYLPAEYLGGSGILATVAAGMYVGERLSEVVPAGTRLKSTSVWGIVDFFLNGVLFLLAGMELRQVIQPESLNEQYLVWGLLIAGLVVVLRAAWCAGAWALFRQRRMLREEDRQPMPASHMIAIGWSGMRGPVSLAAALSVPGLAGSNRLPHFNTLLFLTAIVIVVTLMVQGLGLSYLVKKLGVARDAEKDRAEDDRQMAAADKEAVKAAMDRLAVLEGEGKIVADLANRLRRQYRNRLEAGREGGVTNEIRLALIEAERSRLYQLRNEGRINDRARQELERRLDLRESALTNS